MHLTVRRVTDHPQAVDSNRVKCDGVEIGSIGVQSPAENYHVWTWGIDTVVPAMGIVTHGPAATRDQVYTFAHGCIEAGEVEAAGHSCNLL